MLIQFQHEIRDSNLIIFDLGCREYDIHFDMFKEAVSMESVIMIKHIPQI